MAFIQKQFDKAVWQVVQRIAPGQVMSYGEVARVAGYPRHARMVSKAMSRAEKPLPWHRVLRADRRLAFAPGTEPYNKQKALLEQEGVRLINGKAIPVEKNVSDLDKSLWGPPEA